MFVSNNFTNASITVNSVSTRPGGIMLLNNTAWTSGGSNNKIYGNLFRRDTGYQLPADLSGTGITLSGRTGGLVIDTNYNGTEVADNTFDNLLSGHSFHNFGTNTRVALNNVGLASNVNALSTSGDKTFNTPLESGTLFGWSALSTSHAPVEASGGAVPTHARGWLTVLVSGTSGVRIPFY